MTDGRLQLRRMLIAAAAFLLILVGGIVGFAVIQGESLLDAFYRTVVTVTTVGLVSVPDSPEGKLFTSFLALSGVAVFLYVFGLMMELVVSGVVGGVWQERRRRRHVQHLENHFVICGYGRVGQRVAREFRAAGVPFVVVDADADSVVLARLHGDDALEGSATDDEVLERAGLARAKGLVACVDSDAENVYIALTAREARPGLQIAARASSEDAAKKLRRAGADRVVSPYATAGKELATMLLKPHVAALLDVAGGPGEPEFRFEQIEVADDCGRCGSSIRELRVRELTGATIIAHRRAGEEFNTRPDPDLRIAAGDVLIGVGTPDEIRALEEMFRPRSALV